MAKVIDKNNLLDNEELKVLSEFASTPDVFSFKVEKSKSSGCTCVYVLNDKGKRNAIIQLWYCDTILLDKGVFGDERGYKNLTTAVRGLARRYNNWRKKH